MAKAKENNDYTVSNGTVVLNNDSKYTAHKRRVAMRKKELAEIKELKEEVKRVDTLQSELDELKALVADLVKKPAPKKKAAAKKKSDGDK